MDKGWWHPLPNTEDELKRFQDLPLTGQPFVVRIEQGKVRTHKEKNLVEHYYNEYTKRDHIQDIFLFRHRAF